LSGGGWTQGLVLRGAPHHQLRFPRSCVIFLFSVGLSGYGRYHGCIVVYSLLLDEFETSSTRTIAQGAVQAEIPRSWNIPICNRTCLFFLSFDHICLFWSLQTCSSSCFSLNPHPSLCPALNFPSAQPLLILLKLGLALRRRPNLLAIFVSQVLFSKLSPRTYLPSLCSLFPTAAV